MDGTGAMLVSETNSQLNKTMINLYYWMYGLIGAVLALLVARFVHVWKRQHQMRCKCGKIWRVKKKYQMLQISGNRYEIYAFAVCPCGGVRLIRTENKEFSRSQISRREDKFPEQFDYDQDLFKRAGLIATDTSSVFGMHVFQIRTHAGQNRLQV